MLGCHFQNTRRSCGPGSAAKDLIDLFLGIEDGAGLRLRFDPPNEEVPKEHFINLLCPNLGNALLPGNLFVSCCTVIHTRRENQVMAKVRKRTVRWESSTGATKYRLYWSAQGPVTYDSEFYEIENRTMVVLPDEIPSFPKIAGNIELGVTAVNTAGNESDITIARLYLDFTVPEPPKLLTVGD